MLKNFKSFTIIVTTFLASYLISSVTAANSLYVFDQARALSAESKAVIAKEIVEFKNKTNLTLQVDTVIEPESATLLKDAKKHARGFSKGYYILIGTQVRQHINNLKPTIAIAPSSSEYGKLEKKDYDKIVSVFQPEKQVNLEKAIVSSIDTLQVLVKKEQKAKRIRNVIICLVIAAYIAFVVILIRYLNSKKFKRFRSGGGFGGGGSNCGSSCNSSCGNSCGSSCGSSCGGGCGSS